MVKNKHEHGKLYAHAVSELEKAGISIGKGNVDQKLSSTVLKLVSTFERVADDQLIAGTVFGIFKALITGDLLGDPTNDPNEWAPVSGLGEGVSYNIRCNQILSHDNGISWYRADNNAICGLSKDVLEADNGIEA